MGRLLLAISVLLWAGGAAARPVDLVLGGDCLLGRGVARRAGKQGWDRLLSGVAPVLRRADLAIVNLESPLGRCLPGGTTQRPRLCGDSRGLAALRAAGIDAVTLANNHALDAGAPGLRRTAKALGRAGIAALGLEAARRGRPSAERLGPIFVVAANLTPPAHPPGVDIARPSPRQLARAVRSAGGKAPVVVLLHAGRELDRQAAPWEAAFVRAAVRAGAAAVVLHGAHVIRRLYREGGVPVHLGLGNLLFDQRDRRARVGALLHLRLEAGKPARVVGVSCVDATRGEVVRCPGQARP